MATQIFHLKIPGMDCPSEAAQIEKRFKGTRGLKNLRLSPFTGEMEVEVEPQVLELARVLKILDEIGLPGQVLAQGPGSRPAAAAPSAAFDTTKLA
ncbi:MAG: heavy-metal-associated domain-containing protein, partial [bacterium]